MKTFKQATSLAGGLVLALALHTPPSAQANVYATDISFPPLVYGASLAPGTPIGISYILNEPATGGVTVEILSGTTVARTLTFNNSSGLGTQRGRNIVTWDGKDDHGAVVPRGVYHVRITARATGYSDWTQISNDLDAGNYAYEPTGLAVNKNPNSPYYGRIFVGNSQAGPGTSLGDQVGILKFNADCSYTEDGGFSTGGFTWGGDDFSPWKMAVSADDKLYVNHWSGNGTILAFDQVVSATYLTVLRGDGDNNPTGSANLSGPAVTGSGTGTQIYMCDINYLSPAGTGITRWNVTADGTCAPNDAGTQVVRARSGSDLNIYPYYATVDTNGRIYAIQFRTGTTDSAPRVLRFPAYTDTPLSTADWKVGSADTSMMGAIGLAVNPTATYVAVSFSTYFPSSGGSGGIAILNAADGSLVTRTVAPLDDTPVVEWDNVGNLYACDNGASLWRIYSPPGPNQATTLAVSTLEISGSTPVHITDISVSGSTVTIHFTGDPSDAASAFTLMRSGTVNGTFQRAVNATITGSNGTFQATVPTSGPQQFYTIQR